MSSKTVIFTRLYRKLHRNVGIIFIGFFLLISISGFLLGLKDELGLKPETKSTNSINLSSWISIQSLDSIARTFASGELKIDPEIDRIDIRPDKGIAKILFKNNFQELQLDLESGEILSVEKRADNFISASAVDNIEKMDSSTFNQIVESCIEQLEKNPMSISEKATKYKTAIFEYELNYKRDEETILALKELKKEEVLKELQKVISPKTRKMINLLSFAQNHKEKSKKSSSFKNLEEWKASRSYK